jgi:PAS domain-containing protein
MEVKAAGPEDELMLLARSAPSEELPISVYSTTIRPFDYGKSYYRLLEMLQRRLKGESMTRVCKAMARFRPASIAIVRTLQDADLRLCEQLFQRTIIELARVLPQTAAPYCVWRRTGEVCWASREFSILTGWAGSTLMGGRTITELLDDCGVVEYWEAYSKCVMDSAATYFRVETGIFRPDGKTIQGSLWVTVRKDLFDIPFAMVGCFLPNLWQSPLSPLSNVQSNI